MSNYICVNCGKEADEHQALGRHCPDQYPNKPLWKKTEFEIIADGRVSVPVAFVEAVRELISEWTDDDMMMCSIDEMEKCVREVDKRIMPKLISMLTEIEKGGGG